MCAVQIRSSPHEPRHARSAPPRSLRRLPVTTPAAAAHWTDPVAISAAYTAHTVSSQAQPDCANVNGFLVLGNIARITWSNVDGRYEYRWERRNLAGTVLDSGVVGGGQAVGTDVVLDVSTGLIGSSGNYNVAVRARLKNTPTWIAGSETVTPVRRASIIIIGTSIRCGHS